MVNSDDFTTKSIFAEYFYNYEIQKLAKFSNTMQCGTKPMYLNKITR